MYCYAFIFKKSFFIEVFTTATIPDCTAYNIITPFPTVLKPCRDQMQEVLDK